MSMNLIRFAIVGATLALCSCATVQDYRTKQELLAAPARINQSSDPSTPAYRAQEKARTAYYTAMDAAMAANADGGAIANWIDWGLAANTAECRAWFRRIDDTVQRSELTDKDIGVASGLATTAAGLLDASAKAVTVLGAGLTAVNGFRSNFNTSYLTAPSQDKVFQRVIEVMGAFGEQLKADAPALRPPEVLTRLDAHADLCTPRVMKGTVNDSVSASRATVSPAGTVTTLPNTNTTATFERDPATDRLVAWWMPNGVADPARQARFSGWLQAHGLPVTIPFLLHSPLYAAARAQAAADLTVDTVERPIHVEGTK